MFGHSFKSKPIEESHDPGDAKSQPLLLNYDHPDESKILLSVDFQIPSPQSQSHTFLNKQMWNLVLSYLDDFSDLEKMALFSRDIALGYFGNEKDTDLVIDAASSKIRIEKINAMITHINQMVGVMVEQNRSMLEVESRKKSILKRIASVIPGASFVTGATALFINSAALASTAENDEMTLFSPTCSSYIDLARAGFFTGCRSFFYAASGPNCEDYISRVYGCNLTICNSVCAKYWEANNENWIGAGLVITGAFLICCIGRYFNQEEDFSKTVLQLAFVETFHQEIQEHVRALLNKSDLQNLSIEKVLRLLQKSVNQEQEKLSKNAASLEFISKKCDAKRITKKTSVFIDIPNEKKSVIQNSSSVFFKGAREEDNHLLLRGWVEDGRNWANALSRTEFKTDDERGEALLDFARELYSGCKAMKKLVDNDEILSWLGELDDRLLSALNPDLFCPALLIGQINVFFAEIPDCLNLERTVICP